MRGEFVRFLLVGAVNTATSYLLYLLLLVLLPYLLAYSLAYCIGIVISYFLNVRFVFRRKASLAGFIAFPLVYVIQYGLGVLVLWLLVDLANVSPAWAMIGVIVATIPVTFLASRFILNKKGQPC
ncbi:MAG TPA: GtrA family protein [Gallionella sp.]|nr:GtrA family protein [Gallionella sp.]